MAGNPYSGVRFFYKGAEVKGPEAETIFSEQMGNAIPENASLSKTPLADLLTRFQSIAGVTFSEEKPIGIWVNPTSKSIEFKGPLTDGDIPVYFIDFDFSLPNFMAFSELLRLENAAGPSKGRRILAAIQDLAHGMGIRHINMTNTDSGAYLWAAAGVEPHRARIGTYIMSEPPIKLPDLDDQLKRKLDDLHAHGQIAPEEHAHITGLIANLYTVPGTLREIASLTKRMEISPGTEKRFAELNGTPDVKTIPLRADGPDGKLSLGKLLLMNTTWPARAPANRVEDSALLSGISIANDSKVVTSANEALPIIADEAANTSPATAHHQQGALPPSASTSKINNIVGRR